MRASAGHTGGSPAPGVSPGGAAAADGAGLVVGPDIPVHDDAIMAPDGDGVGALIEEAHARDTVAVGRALPSGGGGDEGRAAQQAHIAVVPRREKQAASIVRVLGGQEARSPKGRPCL